MFTPNRHLRPIIDSPVTKFTFIYKMLFVFMISKAEFSYPTFIEHLNLLRCDRDLIRVCHWLKYFLYFITGIGQNILKLWRNVGDKTLVAVYPKISVVFFHLFDAYC